jgi:F-type H+-transporting ATPase subunit a
MSLAMAFLAAGKAFVTPPAGELFNYKPLFCIGGRLSDKASSGCTGGIAITFPIIMMFVITGLLALLFWRAFHAPKLVPTGMQNVGEVGVDFVRNQIANPVLGSEGDGWVPFLSTMFFWVLFLNFMEITPGINFPITSIIAIPVMLALLSWIIYNTIGIRNQGFFGYFKGIMFPPGVPKPIKPLLAFIEFFSTIIVRPITLAVRLFANMVAGHMILSVLFLGTTVFLSSGLGKITFVLPFAFGVVMTGFELFVAAMQAFIITILTAVYIAGAQEAHH